MGDATRGARGERQGEGSARAAAQELPNGWADFLGAGAKERFARALAAAGARGEHYPPRSEVFRAFELCPPERVKAVVVGQDPYHGAGEAHGLAFSVPAGRPIPPSLRNILKELRADLGWDRSPSSGDLSAWAEDGVLLLNSVLTVAPDQAGSHTNMGWEECTNLVLSELGARMPKTAFVLWGAKAAQKKRLLPEGALLVSGAHPSPLSANRGGFFGGRYFSRVNEMRGSAGASLINWAAIL